MTANDTTHEEITPTQRRAIDALADTLDFTEAAQRVGVEEEELTQWLARDIAFIEAFGVTHASRRDEAFQDVMAPLQWEWAD